MTRPLKKKNGVVAGMPRSGGLFATLAIAEISDSAGRDGSVANFGVQNDDYCSACGGTGQLLCCDGCTRSYHFTCVDPPRDRAPEGQWYCQACVFQPEPTHARGVFPLLQNRLQRRDPSAYNLPRALRNYYEDVVTGEDGEYEETSAPSKARTRGGYDMPADTLRLRDSKDNIILCYKCNKSAMGGREIVDCDFCNLHWHLDCLDPPLASAPKRFGKGTWKCPNHIDSEITLPRSASGRKYKIRKPKDPHVIEPALQRGIKNNGIIEIEDEVSEDEEQPPGTIFRLPAKAIKLDFISKVKRQNLATARMGKHESDALKAEQWRQQHVSGGHAQRRALSPANREHQDDIFQGRTQAERQTALSLAQFAHSDPSSQLSGDRVEQLVNTLITEAPCDVSNLDVRTNGESMDGIKTPDTNGETAAVSTRAKAAASNKAAHGVNQANTVETSVLKSGLASPMTAQEELDELLKLEAMLKAKIAAVRTATVGI
ncbi:MAG: hypothetical protein Q9201_002651 [Fulgogasparrea decipioides]